MPRLAFVLGKRPRPATIVAELVARMRADGWETAVDLPNDEAGVLAGRPFEANLVVQRGLRQSTLRELAAFESAGVRCCNRVRATLAVADRIGVVQRLALAGVPVPATRLADVWSDVRDAAAAGQVFVKSGDGSKGRGAGVIGARDGVPPNPPFDGPWVIQDVVCGDGRVRKIYVAGRHVRALLKPAGTDEPQRGHARLRPSPALIDIAVRTGAALDLEIYGVDILIGDDGPAVVDVNPFPGFREVPDAADLIACHLKTVVRPGDACSCSDPGLGDSHDLPPHKQE